MRKTYAISKASTKALALTAGGLLGIAGLTFFAAHREDLPRAQRQAQASAPGVTTQPAARPIAATRPTEPRSLALRVPDGHRAISLQTTDEIAVSGLLRPGDVVDVQLVLRGELIGTPGIGGGDRSEARTLFENIPVLAVGSVMNPADARDGQPLDARTVTLALLPRQVSAFTLARSLGSIYLALRNPSDASSGSLYRTVLPDIRGAGDKAPKAAIGRAAVPRRHAVQLVVGGESRTVFAEGPAR